MRMHRLCLNCTTLRILYRSYSEYFLGQVLSPRWHTAKHIARSFCNCKRLKSSSSDCLECFWFWPYNLAWKITCICSNINAWKKVRFKGKNRNFRKYLSHNSVSYCINLVCDIMWQAPVSSYEMCTKLEDTWYLFWFWLVVAMTRRRGLCSDWLLWEKEKSGGNWGWGRRVLSARVQSSFRHGRRRFYIFRAPRKRISVQISGTTW